MRGVSSNPLCGRLTSRPAHLSAGCFESGGTAVGFTPSAAPRSPETILCTPSSRRSISYAMNSVFHSSLRPLRESPLSSAGDAYPFPPRCTSSLYLPRRWSGTAVAVILSRGTPAGACLSFICHASTLAISEGGRGVAVACTASPSDEKCTRYT